MSALNKVMLAIAFIVLATAAQSDGIDNGTMQTPGLYFGINNFTTSGGGGGCTNILDFSVACNSQYATVIHF